MPRTLSLTLRESLNAQESSEDLAVLVTINHDDLDEPLRFSSNPGARISSEPLSYGIVSRGETFYFLPMGVTLPEDSDEATPVIRIALDNIQRLLIPLLRSTNTPAQVTIEIVLASAPDDVEVAWDNFDLVEAPYDATTITLNLTVHSLATEPFPAGSFVPAHFGPLT